MKETVEKLKGNVELQNNINALVDEMKKRGFYEIDTFKHTIYSILSEWYRLIIRGQRGKPIGENELVIIDINKKYMTIRHNLYCSGKYDLSDGDFVQLFFENFADYEKSFMEVKRKKINIHI